MRVLLVNPYQQAAAFVSPNLGLGYLAGALLRAGHDVKLHDCLLHRTGPAEFDALLAREPADLVGFQFFTHNYTNVADMLARVRRRLPAAKTVCGGPHPTSAARQTLEDLPDLDFVVRGEGERALAELVAALGGGAEPATLAAIPNLVWRGPDGAVRENPRAFEADLDALAPVAWPLIRPDRYPTMPHGVLNKAFPIAPIMATRGCPHGCTFCSARDQMGARVRTRSPAHIVAEIAGLVGRYGVREIHFEDDNLTFHRDFALEVCDRLISARLGLAWACPNGVRLDRLDETLLRRMEAAGCYSFAAGIESGSARVLQAMHKGTTPDQILEQLRLVRRTTRIKVTGFFLVGYPGETLADLQQTERLILKAPLDRISVSPFVPLPNTRVTAELIRAGRLPPRPDWRRAVSYEDDGARAFGAVPIETLLRRARLVSLRFYARPRVAWSVLQRVHSFSQLRVMARYLAYLVGLPTPRYW